MTLTTGTKLGPYEIQSPLGAGGMGEVYRAKDLRLDRSVAVKILPTHLAEDSDAKQRFDREARTISSLNHPNICTLFDVGHQDGTDFLVMELLEGETLADRLRKGPMPVAQLLKCAIEICDGLDKAHRSGVVHRDLKPGNIMLTKGGAKLMDFGLAKASVASASAASSMSMTLTTPLQTHPLTAAGTVVGTFQYMAPEQVEGRDADARSDIFSLGAVLYEMATGKRAFEGKSAASTMAAILERDPAPISTITPSVPAALERLVKTCLEKDPDERWQTAHDVKLQLKQIADLGSQASSVAVVEAVAPKKKQAAQVAWGIVAFLGAVLACVLALMYLQSKSGAPLMRVEITPPTGMDFNITGDTSGPPVISPDGRYIVFSARKSGQPAQLYLRALDSNEARPLPGTADAWFPFWSPDSKSVAFFGTNSLKRIDLDGSAPVTLCPSVLGRGGSWGPDGTILAALAYNSPISAVSASGGQPRELMKVDNAKYSSYRWPLFLPDGKHFLYLAINHSMSTSPDIGVYFASLDGKENRFLLHTFSSPVYANGYLIFERERTVMAQSFDPDNGKLSGDPIPLTDRVQIDTAIWRTNLSVSNTGLMLYSEGATSGDLTLNWYDRKGNVLESLADLGSYQEVTLSPDMKKVAITDVNTVAANLWIYDFATKLKSRLASTIGVTRTPAWSADGSRIAFVANQQNMLAIKEVAGGSPEQTVLTTKDGTLAAANGWTPDGRQLLISRGVGLGLHLELVNVDGSGQPVPYGDGTSLGMHGQFSPDGRWVAYMVVTESQPTVYVAPFPWTGEKWQVSPGYGIEPRWRADGKEIFFYDSVGIAATEVNATGKNFQVGRTSLLFPHTLPGLTFEYDVTHDGQKFLAVTQGGGSSKPLTLVQNWTAQLKRK